MSAAGFDVDLEMLHAHARRLEAVTDSVALAGAAANRVDLHDGAFGMLCAFLPVLVNGAEQATGDAISAARSAVDAMGDGVRAMARDYASVDDAVRSRMEALGGR